MKLNNIILISMFINFYPISMDIFVFFSLTVLYNQTQTP